MSVCLLFIDNQELLRCFPYVLLLNTYYYRGNAFDVGEGHFMYRSKLSFNTLGNMLIVVAIDEV